LAAEVFTKSNPPFTQIDESYSHILQVIFLTTDPVFPGLGTFGGAEVGEES